MGENKITEIEAERSSPEDGIKDAVYDMNGLKLVLWGLMFTVINFRIQGFDLIPDVIGYIMVIVGLSRIKKYEAGFSAAMKSAYVMTALSLFNIVQVQGPYEVWSTEPQGAQSSGFVNFSAGIFGGIPWLAVLFMVVGTLANIYFAYHMCMGMKRLLLGVGDEALAAICGGRWKLILAAEVGVLVSALMSTLGMAIGISLMLAFLIFSVIALVLFLLLIHLARKSIDGQPEP